MCSSPSRAPRTTASKSFLPSPLEGEGPGVRGILTQESDTAHPRRLSLQGRGEPEEDMDTRFSVQRLVSVARKEWLHIRRDPGTLFFALFIPVIELFMLGYAIDTNIRDLSTIVLDQANTTESRQLI